MIYFHSFRSPGLVLDIVGDIRALNELARKSIKAGMIVLGGGVCKHQIANALLMVRVIFLPERIDRVADCGRA
jgi:deoxyhypusine synthase